MTIRHSRGTYQIVEAAADNLLGDIQGPSFVITDVNVAMALQESLTSGAAKIPTLAIPAGEGSKSMETYGRCLAWLAQHRAPRGSTLYALGGGVIGDLVGFVAATYMRGVRFVQIPTTLLAQVDSSVGGKVGIDLACGKNLVGAFYPPVEVRLAVDVLEGLPSRQFASGMAEVWKYAAIMDAALFDRLAAARLTACDPSLAEVVRRCIALKAEVVEADEFERTGHRAILNFGHTVAHAIELLTGYGPVLHGEAVAIGMVVEARLGEHLGITPSGTSTVLAGFLERDGLPTDHSILADGDAMLDAMRLDKKVVNGCLAFSLLTQIGGCKLTEGITEPEVRAALRP